MSELTKRLGGKIMEMNQKFGNPNLPRDGRKKPSFGVAVIAAMFTAITLSLVALAVSAVHQSFVTDAITRCV